MEDFLSGMFFITFSIFLLFFPQMIALFQKWIFNYFLINFAIHHNLKFTQGTLQLLRRSTLGTISGEWHNLQVEIINQCRFNVQNWRFGTINIQIKCRNSAKIKIKISKSQSHYFRPDHHVTHTKWDRIFFMECQPMRFFREHLQDTDTKNPIWIDPQSGSHISNSIILRRDGLLTVSMRPFQLTNENLVKLLTLAEQIATAVDSFQE